MVKETMQREEQTDSVFEQARPRLMGLAYRVLGSHAEAEDIVQETYLKWLATDAATIESPQKWLTTVCTRKALDSLKAARNARTDYIGSWLPEPLHTTHLNDPESEAILAESLTTAFLLVLDRLAPKERAAFLLHDVFSLPYEEVADSLDMNPSSCRKLVSRARINVQQSRTAHRPSKETQQEFISAFKLAVDQGATDQLAQLLSQTATLSADSNGKVVAIRRPLTGHKALLPFIGGVLRKSWADYKISVTEINAGFGLVVEDQGTAVAALTFAFNDEGLVSDIYIMRNPDKLARLETAGFS